MVVEQPTTERVQFLLTKVTEQPEREVLMRLQAELTSGARHNDSDLMHYGNMWRIHGDKDAPPVNYGMSPRSPQPQPVKSEEHKPSTSKPSDKQDTKR